MEEDNQNLFLTVKEVRDFLRLKKRTLDNMRWMGTGPSFRKHGGRIFYHLDELKEWLLETRAKSTSQF
jgi:Helix-turn-helix domain